MSAKSVWAEEQFMMMDVASEIRRMTKDLQALQNAMQAANNEPLFHGSERELTDVVNAELATQFKGVLDAVRHFLWCCAEPVSAKQPWESVQAGVDRGYRRLIAEMLQGFAQCPAPRTREKAPTSFFERIDFLVSSRLAAEKFKRDFDRDAA
jgi:hypothetical protein